MKLTKIILIIITLIVIVIPNKIEALSNDSKINSITYGTTTIKCQKDKTKYNLKIPYFTKKVDFNIKLSDPNATYEIIDNNQLKDQSIIIVRVTSEDNNITDYKLKVKKNIPTYLTFGFTLGIIYLFALIISIIIKHQSKVVTVKIV